MCSKPVVWKGAHCCGYGPYNLHVNQKSDDDDDDDETLALTFPVSVAVG